MDYTVYIEKEKKILGSDLRASIGTWKKMNERKEVINLLLYLKRITTMSHKLDDLKSWSKMRRALCIRFFIKSCCFINISIAFREENISKHLFPPSWKRRISRQRYLIVDYSTTNRVEETSRDQSASWMNFRGIIDQDFDKGASARRWPHPCRITNWKKVLRIRGVDAWYRKGRERERKERGTYARCIVTSSATAWRCSVVSMRFLLSDTYLR